MNSIEKAARALCAIHNENPDDRNGDRAKWTYYIPHIMGVIDALHEPSLAMKEAGSEIIRHVGSDEDDASYRSDAANIWRFMMDVLHQEAAHLR